MLKQSLRVNGEKVHGEVETKAGYLAEKVTTMLDAGEKYELEKDVIVITSRDVAPDEQAERADLLMHELCEHTFSENLAEHEAIWQKRWEKSDVKLKAQTKRNKVFALIFSNYS